MNYPMIAAELARARIMAEPAAAIAWLDAMAPRIFGSNVVVNVAGRENSAPDRRMGIVGDPMLEHIKRDDWDRGARPIADTGVAVLEIEGALVPKGKWSGQYCGETTYEWIEAAAMAAKDDPAVRGVILEVDSPGGAVDGCFEALATLAELADAKPVIAILTPKACSAAYLLACAARTIVIPATGCAGSIGAIGMHIDMSGAMEKAGVRITPIFSGARKNDWSPFAPLPDDVRARAQGEIDDVREMFARAVAAARPGRLDFDAAMATEAAVYYGADAVANGLADVVAMPRDAVRAFVEEIGRTAN